MKQFPISKTVTQLACFNIHWITVPGAGAADSSGLSHRRLAEGGREEKESS